jgi:uncharacterized membrane protein
MLHHWLYEVSEPAIAAIDLMALLLILGATLYTFAAVILLLVRRVPMTSHQRRLLWLNYARWLVAALTFQLAADIIESSIARSWEAIGQLGAIAVIRTFLNYFLERDVAEMGERDEAGAQAREVD